MVLLKVPVLWDVVLFTRVLLKVLRLISQSSKHVSRKMPPVSQICKTIHFSTKFPYVFALLPPF